jgi:MFS family permease
VTQSPSKPRFFLGWTVVAVAAFATFAEVAFFNPVLGVFIPEFEREFGWSRTEISAAVTIGSLVGAGCAPFFGPLIDRYGGRLFVVGGSLIMAGGLLALSMMQNEWQFFLIYAIGRGAAAGIIGLAVSVTVSKWFIRRRGYAVGITFLGTRFGFALMPLGVQLLIQSYDWRTAALTLAGVVVVCGVLPALRWLHPRPERFGLEPDGDVTPPVAAGAPPPPREVDWTRHDAIRTRAFWLITASIAIQQWAGGAINLHQIPHLVDKGLSPEAAAGVISFLAVFGGVGAILEGILDARIGARRTMIIGLLGSAAGMVVLISTETVAMGLVFAVIYGTAFGMLVTSSQIVFADFFGREALGAIRGSAAPVQFTFNAIGPLVAGIAHDVTGSYLAAFIPFTIAYLVAVVALVIARRPVPPVKLHPTVERAG